MNTMNMPSFTAENSIYETRGRYRMATAFNSQNVSANVQPAATNAHCRPFLRAAFAAVDRGDDLWAEFYISAWEGCLGN